MGPNSPSAQMLSHSPAVFWALAVDQAGNINGSDSGIVLWNSQSRSRQIQAKTDLVQSSVSFNGVGQAIVGDQRRPLYHSMGGSPRRLLEKGVF